MLSCGNMNKFNKTCAGFEKGNSELVIIEKNDLMIGGYSWEVTYDSLINELGMEFRSNKSKNDDIIFDQLHFDYKGNIISYYMKDSVCRLVFVQFKNNNNIGNFKNIGLSQKTKLSDFVDSEKEAFCSSIYYEQQNKFVLQFLGEVDKELYELEFENRKLVELRVVW